MALIVFDASAVIALLDPADALHVSARREFERWAGDDLVIPATALAETLVVPSRMGSLDAVQASIRSLDMVVAPVGEAVAVEAAQLRGRHRGLRLPDALVLAAGEVLAADAVVTGDVRWIELSPRVRIIR
ncbi:MAG: type II toxin-antitoxin system VapC family toxin [Candidatus Dormibacteria bacterium]